MVMLLWACSPTKYVQDDEYLLDENVIELAEDSTLFSLNLNRNVTADDLYPIIKQKPNRRLLGVRFHLRMYSLSNQKRIDRRRAHHDEKAAQKNLKIDQKNEKRKAKGKPLHQYMEPKTTFGEGLRNSGEPPAILDSNKIVKSAKQIENYLTNKGYFNNEVSYKVEYGRRQKSKVIYHVDEKQPYTIRNINTYVKDSVLNLYIDSIEQSRVFNRGDIFDSDKLNAERIRINKYLLDHGYHFFNKEFIYFRIDSSLNSHQVDVTLGIQNYKVKDPLTDSIIERPHRQYMVKRIELYPDHSPKDDSAVNYIKVIHDDIGILFKDKLKYKEKLLTNSLFIKENELYNKTQTEKTYRSLASLGVFRSVSIQFDTTDNGLVAKARLQPAKSQTFTAATDGLHNNGLYGIEGSLIYTHNNLFGGAEKLQISVAGGFEAQRLVVNDSATATDVIPTFNTKEFGPRMSLTFPRLMVPFKQWQHAPGARTEFSASMNFQERPDFKRSIEEVSFAYLFKIKKPINVRLYPASLSAISIQKDSAFENKLNELNDRLLLASYSDHIIAGSRITMTYNGQDHSHSKNVFFTEVAIDWAGNVLRGLYNLSNQPLNTETNSYDLLGIRFAQYKKYSLDVRYYRVLTKRSKVVYRAAVGFGKPGKNLSEALPFEKSFFSGGANGIRAWKARTLGPGGYYDSLGGFDKIGDIQLESNMELRFPISSWIEGAWFADAGNIWLINEDSLRTEGEFQWDRFISEVAIGTGLGVRMDLDFLIVRFDFAIPFKNPALRPGNRWIFQGKLGDKTDVDPSLNFGDFYPIQFNLGIGYPF